MNKLNTDHTITLKKDKVVAHHNSDGSELIPAQVKANTGFDSKTPISKGYTVDDEGIINNYATEPDTSLANYPSPEQQKRYIFLGAGATLFVAIALGISFTVS